MVKKEWIEKGYVDEPIDETLDLKADPGTLLHSRRDSGYCRLCG